MLNFQMQHFFTSVVLNFRFVRGKYHLNAFVLHFYGVFFLTLKYAQILHMSDTSINSLVMFQPESKTA